MKYLLIFILSTSFFPPDLSMAKSLIAKKQYHEALLILENNQDDRARYYAGWCYMQLGDCSTAADQFNLFIQQYVGDNSVVWKAEATANIIACEDHIIDEVLPENQEESTYSIWPPIGYLPDRKDTKEITIWTASITMNHLKRNNNIAIWEGNVNKKSSTKVAFITCNGNEHTKQFSAINFNNAAVNSKSASQLKSYQQEKQATMKWESDIVTDNEGRKTFVHLLCNHAFHQPIKNTSEVSNIKNTYLICDGVAHENIWESRMRVASGTNTNPKGKALYIDDKSAKNNTQAKVKHENVWESRMIMAPSGDDINYHFCNGVAHENVWESRMIMSPGSSSTDMDDSSDDIPTENDVAHENVWESRMIMAPNGDTEVNYLICNGVAHEKVWESRKQIAGSDLSNQDQATGVKHENVWESRMIMGPNGSTSSEIVTLICNHVSHVKMDKPQKEPSKPTHPIKTIKKDKEKVVVRSTNKQHHYKVLFTISKSPDKPFISLSSIGPVYAEKAKKGNYLYYIGHYPSQAKANTILESIKAKGYSMARVVEFNKGTFEKDYKTKDQATIIDKVNKTKHKKEKIIKEQPIVETKPAVKKKHKPSIQKIIVKDVITYHILFRVLNNPYEEFDDLKSIGPLSRETFNKKGGSRYLVGNMNNLADAKIMLSKVKAAGYKAAVIAEYKDGELERMVD